MAYVGILASGDALPNDYVAASGERRERHDSSRVSVARVLCGCRRRQPKEWWRDELKVVVLH